MMDESTLLILYLPIYFDATLQLTITLHSPRTVRFLAHTIGS